jgi:hypothetical protein
MDLNNQERYKVNSSRRGWANQKEKQQQRKILPDS